MLASSTQTFINQSTTKLVNFEKQVTPPVATLDHGALYELTDGVLYFNGQALSGASVGDVKSDITVSTIDTIPVFADTTGKLISDTAVRIQSDSITDANSVIMTPAASNPGIALGQFADALYLSSAVTAANDQNLGSAQLMHAASSLENFPARKLYISDSGRGFDAGATGSIADPFDTFADAFSRTQVTDKQGAVLTFDGQFGDALYSVPPNIIIHGSCMDFRSVITGDFYISGGAWATASPAYYNQLYICNCVFLGNVLATVTGFEKPRLSFKNVNFRGLAVEFTGYAAESELNMYDCSITGTGLIEDIDANIRLIGSEPGTLNISTTAARVGSMSVHLRIDDPRALAAIAILHSGPSALRVIITGFTDACTITAFSASAAGVTILLDDTRNLTIAPGAVAHTTIENVKQANRVFYDTALSGLAADDVQAAIDELAAATLRWSASGCADLPGAQLTILPGNQTDVIYSATQAVNVYVHSAVAMNALEYSVSRALVGAESIIVELWSVTANAAVPGATFTLNSVSGLTGVISFADYTFSAGHRWCLVSSAYTPTGGALLMSWSVAGYLQ